MTNLERGFGCGLMLTHVGLRRLHALRRAGRSPSPAEAGLVPLARTQPADPGEAQVRDWLRQGWVQAAPPTLSKEAIQLLYERNPLEHVARINFEVTTRCNFGCRHCRNADAVPTTERDFPRLVEAARLFLSLGIRRFDFIGGEVSRHGDGWLGLAEQISRTDAAEAWPEPLAITVYTNGWWLESRQFEAAGQVYADEREYLRSLKQHGVTHVVFSIDGPEALHDDWRGHPGLFRRILAGIPRVASEGLAPRLSVVVRRGEPARYLRPLAHAIHGKGEASLGLLLEDPFNHFSNFIDIGRGEQFRRGSCSLDDVDPRSLRCKAFFRPHPTLRVMASGEIGICPLMLGQEAFGNLHRRSLLEILNGLHETPLYSLHATGSISRYLERIDRGQFGERFDHLCSVRVAANRLALADSRPRSEEALGR